MKTVYFKLSCVAVAVSAVGSVQAGAQGLTAPVGNLVGVVTPGVVGNTAQVGVGNLRVGSTDGAVGGQGTPTTKVGVNVLTKNNPPTGSVATISVPRGTGH